MGTTGYWTTSNKTSNKEKAHYQKDSGLSMCHAACMVGSERFELSTYGLRVPSSKRRANRMDAGIRHQKRPIFSLPETPKNPDFCTNFKQNLLDIGRQVHLLGGVRRAMPDDLQRRQPDWICLLLVSSSKIQP